MNNEWTRNELAKTIDHTLLKAIATEEQIREHCAEAKKFGFATVCVNPGWVKLCAHELAKTDVLVCTVIGFPLGANLSRIKALEAEAAVADGASEVDMVINIGMARAGQWKAVEEDIRAVVKAVPGSIVKVIIETCYLNDTEKVKCCELIKNAGAAFVKTCTGFGTSGATAEDIKLLRKTVGDSLKIKASGGIRSYHDVITMLNAGADRIGASSSVAIVTELP